MSSSPVVMIYNKCDNLHSQGGAQAATPRCSFSSFSVLNRLGLFQVSVLGECLLLGRLLVGCLRKKMRGVPVNAITQKTADAEELFICPFEPSHRISAMRFVNHAVKCEKSHPHISMVR